MKGYSLATAGKKSIKVTGWSASMQSLVLQVIAMKQIGRLNPRHLLAAGYGTRRTEWCPRTIHTRQLWGCSTFPSLGGQRTATKTWSLHQLRFKSKRKSPSRTAQEQDEAEEETDPEESDYEDVDPNLPRDYKDMEKYVPSFRYDVVLKAGLDLARNKIEDAFYSNKLRLNGQKLIKKSKTVKVGDTLDLVLSENNDANTVTLMRVILRKVLGESNDGDKHKVSIRRWKSLELAKDEAFKP
ncbi:mitochondrial transcription rescue factor 1-like isoform X1 [Cyprinodon tularosa]|uniref:mitochondrial transcription rescue factor 1-like isoform X1 n=1 Tax=Cyprinodon tularosa TaxID=77115 RepID=UPI0018E245DA|nr:mitochondrial transcription rescue factor 1-like isoform X1 [Cyprinodon tularosa]